MRALLFASFPVLRLLGPVLGLVLGLAAAPAIAHAEDIAVYETDGEADAAGSDPRVAALDEAFSRAVSQALADVVDSDTRKANRAAINEHVLGRARLWVAKFTVTRDETSEGRRQLTVSVRVDRDKMRARLGELNIATTSAGAAGDPARPGARSVVILLRTSDGKAARATYGASAEKELPGLGALSGALRGAGLAVKRAPASGPVPRPDGELPLDDDTADALAAEAKAEVAAIAGVTVGEPVDVRGLPTQAVLVTANVRLIGSGRKLIGQGVAAVASRGTEGPPVSAAIERALVAAASDVVPPPKQQLGRGQAFTGDDAPVGEPGVVLVRLAKGTPWGLVTAEQKWLSGAKGVQRAVVRRLSPNGWVIGVTTTESAERIAQIARKSPASGTSAKVKLVGDIVEVALAGAP